ncbi:uncharacterized protein BDZ99DRAFT_277743 [Mytilinidion resinicola]|uniref:Uncharacterized protein n=1 Tax=Mytilinidion resinicola TaxID=574789 RepID=A0A6A6YUG1_9PEZI|nr:uncharacterized protein BDZ99DRAFT_277743 [Mytilinidion resinicola]KAF2811605.1 hypothetical protein BDZ99DRAFT_277743 [Mytilinidion resinicola]
MEVRSFSEGDGSDSGESIGTAGDVEGIQPAMGEGIIITQPAIDDNFSSSPVVIDARYLDILTFGHVYASSGIRRWRRNGAVNEIDWALVNVFDEQVTPWNVVPGCRQFCIDPAAAARQDSLRMKQDTNWKEYYKNGLPNEIIVTDDDDDDTSSHLQRQPILEQPAIDLPLKISLRVFRGL